MRIIAHRARSASLPRVARISGVACAHSPASRPLGTLPVVCTQRSACCQDSRPQCPQSADNDYRRPRSACPLVVQPVKHRHPTVPQLANNAPCVVH
ncbi:UNVERIFIED_CONTAM: hypothetical protein Sradi_2432400 [Sesamum radiatum]|uniref:Secreted protein n=1 Tax=Sesamum radiatum TaxID=300843 RepID=A0AAW2SKD1_SESRA